MPGGHESRDPQAAHPTPKTARDTTTVSLTLLRGTIASLRCGEELDAGQLASAREFFSALQRSLEELESMTLDEAQARDADRLRSRESKLSRSLAAALRRAGSFHAE